MKPKWTPVMAGFEVETCTELPCNDDGEADYDAATYKRFDFPNNALELAKQKAKQLLPEDKFGAVIITDFILEPLVPNAPMRPSFWHKVYGNFQLEISNL